MRTAEIAERVARELEGREFPSVDVKELKELHGRLKGERDKVDSFLTWKELSENQRRALTEVVNHIEGAMDSLTKAKR